MEDRPVTRLTTLIVGLTGLLAACVPPRIEPEITRRYLQHTFAPDDQHLVAVSVFSLPADPPSATAGVAGLTEGGQAELVKAFAGRTDSPTALSQALGLPIRADRPTPVFRDLTRVQRRLVFSVENQSREPADRISWARIRVLMPGEARFVNWNKLASEYQTVDLGSLAYTRGSSNSFELGLTLPLAEIAPKLSSAAESSLEEKLQLQQQRVRLSGSLTPKEAVLLQQGAMGIDLTGNIVTDVEIAVRWDREPRVFLVSVPMTGGRPNCERQPVLRQQVLRLPAVIDSLRVDVILEYLVRRVHSGHETVNEGDDVVTYLQGADTVRGVPIIPREELSVPLFQIRAGGEAIHLRNTDASSRAILVELASFEEAEDLMRWLRGCPGRIEGYGVLLGGRAVQPKDLRSLYVWREDPR